MQEVIKVGQLTKSYTQRAPRNTCPAGRFAARPQIKGYPKAPRNSCPSGGSAAKLQNKVWDHQPEQQNYDKKIPHIMHVIIFLYKNEFRKIGI